MITGVKAIITRTTNNNEILFGYNSKRGSCVLPGGSLERDEDMQACLFRELEEETGISKSDIISYTYLYDMAQTAVFLLNIKDAALTVKNDPDNEFSQLVWLPLEESMFNIYNICPYCQKILLSYMNHIEMVTGAVEVLVDGKHFAYLDDDEIWLTMPGLAQEQAKGKKISYRVVQSYEPHDMIIEEVLNKYFNTLSRPSVEWRTNLGSLAKTTLFKDGTIKIYLDSVLHDDLDIMRQVLCHELIHAYLFNNGLGDGHVNSKELFNMIADRINNVEGEGYIAPFAEMTIWRS